jgi:thiol-disulfide isomerase/thioredoxin
MKILIILLFFISFAEAQLIRSAKPWLGIAIDKGPKGVLVKQAIDDTPAQKAGIMAGDQILSVDKKKVMLPQELITEIANSGVGNTVAVRLLRAGVEKELNITLVAKPSMLKLINNKLLNRPAPQFKVDVIRGRTAKTFEIKEQLGKVTVIEFWATWCPACVGSLPTLIKFANHFKGKIDVLAISSEDKGVILKYLKRVDKSFPKKSNPITFLRSENGAVNRQFMATSIPMFFLIDKKGHIVKIALGGGVLLNQLLNEAAALNKI